MPVDRPLILFEQVRDERLRERQHIVLKPTLHAGASILRPEEDDFGLGQRLGAHRCSAKTVLSGNTEELAAAMRASRGRTNPWECSAAVVPETSLNLSAAIHRLASKTMFADESDGADFERAMATGASQFRPKLGAKPNPAA